jgi:hypothetical protein
LENLSRAAITVKTLATRGVTLWQLVTIYHEGCQNGTIEPESTTTSDVVMDIVVPASAAARQSWVESVELVERRKQDKEYADEVATRKKALENRRGDMQLVLPDRKKPFQNPMPGCFVIHAWNGLFRDLLRAVVSHATRDPNPSLDLTDPLWVFAPPRLKEMSYFIDVFCVNQHATLNQFRRYGLDDTATFHTGDAACQIDKFHLIAEQIQNRKGRVLIVVDYDNLVLKRTLCLKEVHQAICGQPDKIDVNFSRLPSFPYDKMFIPVETSKASCTADKDSTLREIEEDRGGLQVFDREIVEFMTNSISAKYQEKIQSLMPKEIRGIDASE